jgi:hypothetical protein
MATIPRFRTNKLRPRLKKSGFRVFCSQQYGSSDELFQDTVLESSRESGINSSISESLPVFCPLGPSGAWTEEVLLSLADRYGEWSDLPTPPLVLTAEGLAGDINCSQDMPANVREQTPTLERDRHVDKERRYTALLNTDLVSSPRECTFIYRGGMKAGGKDDDKTPTSEMFYIRQYVSDTVADPLVSGSKISV